MNCDVRSLSSVTRSVREVCSAGTSPKSSPVRTESPKVNSSTRRSKASWTWLLRSMGGRTDQSMARPHQASTIPATPPRKASSRLSVSSCWIMPAAGGAERDADRDLLAAGAGAGQQQVGHVDARDQQHQPDDSHQELADVDELVAQIRIDQAFGQRQERDGAALVFLRIPGGELRGSGFHARLGLVATDARLQPSNEREQQGAAGSDLADQREDLFIHRHRHPQVGADQGVGALKTRGSDTDDGEAVAVEMNRTNPRCRGRRRICASTGRSRLRQRGWRPGTLSSSGWMARPMTVFTPSTSKKFPDTISAIAGSGSPLFVRLTPMLL